MAWADEMVTTLRVMVNDNGETQKYTDDRLAEAILVAARLVQAKARFANSYVTDIENQRLTPDPTTSPRDEWFITLCTVRAACIVDQGATLTAAGQAIRIKDGPSEIDLRDAFKAKLAMFKDGWCKGFEDLLTSYQTGQQSVGVGAVVFGPIKRR